MGIDFIIQPERATAEDLAAAIALPGAVHVERLVEGRVVVAETIVARADRGAPGPAALGAVA